MSDEDRGEIQLSGDYGFHWQVKVRHPAHVRAADDRGPWGAVTAVLVLGGEGEVSLRTRDPQIIEILGTVVPGDRLEVTGDNSGWKKRDLKSGEWSEVLRANVLTLSLVVGS